MSDIEMTTIIAVINMAARHEGRWYWTGTAVSAEYSRAKRFTTREEAFCEWNDNAANYPDWHATLIDVAA